MPDQQTPTTSVKPTLPSVRFARIGDVTAAEAVGVEGPDSTGAYLVYVLHPTGGRVHVGWEPNLGAASYTQSALRDAITAWAELGR